MAKETFAHIKRLQIQSPSPLGLVVFAYFIRLLNLSKFVGIFFKTNDRK
jgi:hypothetical protein